MAYVKIMYQNSPSTATPINAENLNHMDDQIALNDQRLTELEGAHVSSFNGRTGAVAPADNDYNIGQIAPLTGAQVGQVPVVVNVGTEEDPELKFAMGAGGGGGHVIQNASGTDMPQESAMQFPDSHVSDDSANGRTVVENIKEHTTASDYENATEDGIHVINDGNDVPIGASSEDYVEVTADGEKTYRQLLNELFNETDKTKVTENSCIEFNNEIFAVVYADSQYLTFTKGYSSQSKVMVDMLALSASGSGYKITPSSGTETDKTLDKPSNGTVITLYYGTSSTVINLKTDANYCQYDENNTVKQAIDAIDAKIAVINDYTPSTVGGSKDIAFPNGFTMTNSVILTVSINLGNVVFTSATTGNYLYAMYKSNGTGISLGLINDAPSGATNKAVKIVLMKIS